MLRLVFEAVMIIAIVSGLVFMMKINAKESQEELDSRDPESGEK